MISVVIATYKRPKSLNNLLDSIFAQTYLPYEIVLIDDCSNMRNEYEIMISNLPKSKIKIRYLINAENMGAPYSRNRGIRAAQGKWIALVDDDDLWLKDKLESQQKIINDHSINCDFITCNSYIKRGEETYEPFIIPNHFKVDPIKSILQSNYIMSPTVLIRKSVLLDVGLFDEKFPSCQDWDLWTRIILKGYKIVSLNKILTIYKKDNINSIGLSMNAKRGYRLYIRKHFINIIKYSTIKNWIKMIFVYLGTYR